MRGPLSRLGRRASCYHKNERGHGLDLTEFRKKCQKRHRLSGWLRLGTPGGGALDSLSKDEKKNSMEQRSR